MTQVRDFLDRFRPGGAPGAATQAGVPADRTREQADELDPVLALLDDVHAECERIRQRAERQAERIAGQARARTAAIGEEAARRARIARDEAAREVLEAASEEAQIPVAKAREQAAKITERARVRMPGLVARAVEQVRSESGVAGEPTL